VAAALARTGNCDRPSPVGELFARVEHLEFRGARQVSSRADRALVEVEARRSRARRTRGGRQPGVEGPAAGAAGCRAREAEPPPAPGRAGLFQKP